MYNLHNGLIEVGLIVDMGKDEKITVLSKG